MTCSNPNNYNTKKKAYAMKNRVGLMDTKFTFESNKVQNHSIHFKICAHENWTDTHEF